MARLLGVAMSFWVIMLGLVALLLVVRLVVFFNDSNGD
jgi:hypothetical protein